MYLEDLCFQAQQAAEKALKAVLIMLNVRFPHTHDLSALLSLAEKAGQLIPRHVREAALLTDYAVEARYPGFGELVTQEEYVQAVSIAAEAVRWAEALMQSHFETSSKASEQAAARKTEV